MKKYIILVCFSCGLVFSQDTLKGIIKYQDNNEIIPLVGADV